MQAPNKSSELQLIGELIKSKMKGVQTEMIKEYSHRLFPISASSRIYESLYISLYTFYSIRISKRVTPQAITSELLALSAQLGVQLKNSMQQLLQGQFLQSLIGKIIKAKQPASRQPSFSESKQKGKNKEEKKSKCSVQSIDLDNNDSEGNQRAVLMHKQTSPKLKIKNDKAKNNSEGETENVQNISQSDKCICGQQVKPDADTFTCLSCKNEYHLACMNVKEKKRYCAICHLKHISPNKVVKKTLFMGVLSKQKHKHFIWVSMSQQEVQSQYLLQVSCFRLKQSTTSFILFPDYFKMMVGKQILKQFLPIHKQSSLKYRKDQPFILPNKHIFTSKTKIIINQKPLFASAKTDRIEPQNHLIGIFLIQPLSVQTLFQQLKLSAVTTFEESQKILLSAFESGGVSEELDELLLLVVKIPLTCTLSTEKMKQPARGIFCTHSQCFDLYNFLVLTAQSTNPRWICPLCRLPCFAFKIDCILLAILEQHREINDIKELTVHKTGEYAISCSSSPVPLSVDSIYNLDLAPGWKRTSLSKDQGFVSKGRLKGGELC